MTPLANGELEVHPDGERSGGGAGARNAATVISQRVATARTFVGSVSDDQRRQRAQGQDRRAVPRLGVGSPCARLRPECEKPGMADEIRSRRTAG